MAMPASMIAVPMRQVRPWGVLICCGVRTSKGISDPTEAHNPKIIAIPRPKPSIERPMPVSVDPMPQHIPKPAMLMRVFAELAAYAWLR